MGGTTQLLSAHQRRIHKLEVIRDSESKKTLQTGKNLWQRAVAQYICTRTHASLLLGIITPPLPSRIIDTHVLEPSPNANNAVFSFVLSRVVVYKYLLEEMHSSRVMFRKGERGGCEKSIAAATKLAESTGRGSIPDDGRTRIAASVSCGICQHIARWFWIDYM